MKPETGSRWTRKKDASIVRVMAVVEGWVMMRIPHCVPFLLLMKDFVEQFENGDL